ncbi:HlyD family efflux transporter periplasmic adaptor subunit [Pseudoalteromonas sp. YIC-656]|uniref:HlyD family secretion protein n=1 Tax=Pseudoalteromonas pernae TaxID=3118054 RepID=UPI003241D8B5
MPTVKHIILSLVLMFVSISSVAKTLLLSGELKASEQQRFYAPKTDNWRVQVQWLMKEGEIAQPGDVVVVFDSGSVAAEVEQTQQSLISKKEELQKAQNDGKQKLAEAQFALERAQLVVDKARIDARIPETNLSRYDYEENQLALERALVDKQKAESTYSETKTSTEVEVNKKLLEIELLEFDLQHQQASLEKMSLTAERSGPVIWANHPWNGSKLFAGVTAQPGWKIVEIPSLSELYIEAWVHEVDYPQLTIGDSAELVFDAHLNTRHQATLTELSTQPEERSQWGEDAYFRARFDFDNSQISALLPGMSARLAITQKELTGE